MGNRPDSSNRIKRPTIRNVKGTTIVVTTTNTTATTPQQQPQPKPQIHPPPPQQLQKKWPNETSESNGNQGTVQTHHNDLFLCVSLPNAKRLIEQIFYGHIFGILTILKYAIQIDLLNKTIDLSVFA